MTHPDKCGRPMVDLSTDSEAMVGLSTLSESRLGLERVITKVFHHYGIPLDISDAIRTSFKSKLWRMGSTSEQSLEAQDAHKRLISGLILGPFGHLQLTEMKCAGNY